MRVSQFWVAKQVYTVTGPVLDPSGDVVLADGPSGSAPTKPELSKLLMCCSLCSTASIVASCCIFFLTFVVLQ